MDTIQIWNVVSASIGFYTKETAQQIPEQPGIYAWFIPLWVYDDDIFELIKFSQEALLYDSDFRQKENPGRGKSKRNAQVNFNWDYLKLEIEKKFKLRDEDSLKKWNKSEKGGDNNIAIKELLMKASIFTKPLYIGRADNLRVRYNQHIGGSIDKNIFYSRFNEFISQSSVEIEVYDLIFACIPLTQESNNAIKEKDMTEIVESILMNIVQPPFSCK